MKIRLDYVTNSSSSSFVCDICNRSGTVYDGSINELDMVECANGHVMCNCEAEDYINKLNYTGKTFKERMMRYLKESQDFIGFDEEDLNRWIEDDDASIDLESIDSIPVDMCPICQLEEASMDDFIGFLTSITGITRKDYLEHVKDNFGSYSDYKNFTRSGRL